MSVAPPTLPRIAVIDSRDAPRGGQLRGWVLPADGPGVAVEVSVDGHRAVRAPVNVERPDLAEAFPALPHAPTGGYRIPFDLSALGAETEIAVDVTTSGGRQRLARLRIAQVGRDASQTVTVVMTTRNQVHPLPGAIESALSQTHVPSRILVVDGGSHDHAEAVVRRHPPIRYLQEPNGGVAAARNGGLFVSEGSAVLFLEADLRLRPGAIAAGLAAAAAADADRAAAAAGVGVDGRGGGPLGTRVGPRRCAPFVYREAGDAALLCRRETLVAAGGAAETDPSGGSHNGTLTAAIHA